MIHPKTVLVAFGLFCITFLVAQQNDQYFPKETFISGSPTEDSSRIAELLSASISEELTTLNEPALYLLSKSTEVYRLVCSGGFYPILFSIRVELNGLLGSVIYKEPNYNGSNNFVVVETRRRLSLFQVIKIRKLFNAVNFKNESSLKYDDSYLYTLDGMGCLIESYRDGNYNALCRGLHTELQGSTNIILYMFKLVGMEIDDL